MAGRESDTKQQDHAEPARTAALGPESASDLTLAAAIGNVAMSRVARSLGSHAGGRAGVPRPGAAARVLARDGPDGGVDGGTGLMDPYGGTLPPGGLPPDSALPEGAMPVPAQVPQQAPGQAAQGQAPVPAAVPQAPPDRDTIVRTAIETVLSGFTNLTVTIPVTMPPAPGRRATTPAAPAAPTAPVPEGGDGGAPAQPAAPAQVSFSCPYFINRSSGDGGAGGGSHGLGAAGVSAWFSALPNAVKVGKGSSAQIQAAMQQAVDQGLLNSTWPPTATSAVAFMRGVGLGVDCSGFVYLALMAADAALQGAGMTGLTTPQTTSIGNTGSQAIGRSGGTQVTRPGDLRAGDIVQMAPTATSAVGHIRIVTSVRAAADYVEYDTAESTRRVGDGPQASTWRLPAAGPMDSAHLQVHNATSGAWDAEPSGRPSTYWRRLAVPQPAAATGAATGGAASSAPPVARSLARAAARKRARAPSAAERQISRADPRSGGWNEGDRDVTGTWRIQVSGLAQGLARDDTNAATAEEAQHRAVAIVPKAISPANLEVLVHFHGNNLGERERKSASPSGMAAGTVRDVEADLMPQQIAASGRNIIAILPQGKVDSGTLKDKFGITNVTSHVADVLGKVVGSINQLDPAKNLQGLTPVRIDISGHSGGGPSSTEAAAGLEATSASSDDEWLAAPPLLLFDAINGPGEAATVGAMAVRWLNEDKRRLLGKPATEAEPLLRRRGLKLRSTYTGGVYWVTNTKRDPRSYRYGDKDPVTVPKEQSLEYQIDEWFKRNGAALGSLTAILREQYVVEQHVGASHEFTVGAGSLQKGPREAVPGVTKAPGAPAGSNEAPANASGNLASALGKLSPADQVAPRPAAAPSASSAPPSANGAAPRTEDPDAGAPAPDPSLGGTLPPGGAPEGAPLSRKAKKA